MEAKKELLEKAGFKCVKCNYYSPLGHGLEINPESKIVLCSICNTFAPVDKLKLNEYINEKVSWQALETFRKFKTNRASHEPHKQGMINRAQNGSLMARPAFGYDVKKGKLEANGDSENVRLIFKEFLAGKSLNQISKTYGISVNGIKKILKNFTYIGKIKFANQISQGTHQAIIPIEMFNDAQRRFEFLKSKKAESSGKESIKLLLKTSNQDRLNY